MIDTGAGVIDSDYRGHVQVLLFNHGDSDFELYHGDRIAQLVLERIANPEVVEVDELEESVRGVGGFGSTGGFGPRTGAQVQAQAEAAAASAEVPAQPFGSTA
jgi:dUTP pyrophosphatase